MVGRKTEISDHFIHAGAGTGLAIVNLGALIPGFVPFLALTALVTVVLVAPFLILGFAAVIGAAWPGGSDQVRARIGEALHWSPPQQLKVLLWHPCPLL